MNRAGVEVPSIEELVQSPPPGYHPPDQLAYLFNVEVKSKSGEKDFPSDKLVERQGKNNFAELIAIAAGMSFDDKNYIEHSPTAEGNRMVDLTTTDSELQASHNNALDTQSHPVTAILPTNNIMTTALPIASNTVITPQGQVILPYPMQPSALPSIAGNSILHQSLPSEAPLTLNDPLKEAPKQIITHPHQQMDHFSIPIQQNLAAVEPVAVPPPVHGGDVLDYTDETYFQLQERARKGTTNQQKAAILMEFYNKCKNKTSSKRDYLC